jgi:uncharacterized membrane protein
VVTGLLAGPFGTIDWFAIPSGTRAKRIGGVQGIGNVLVVLLFAVSWLTRGDAPATPGGVALTLSFAGGCLALFTGWLGGELVDRLGVGVDDGCARRCAQLADETPDERLMAVALVAADRQHAQ